MADAVSLFPELQDGPLAVREKPTRRCNTEQHVKEMLGLPSDWQQTRWRIVGDPKNPIGVEISGGVYKHMMLRGTRKGHPDWRKPEPGTVITATLGVAQHDHWRAQWEAETGLCRACEGTGIVFASSHKEHGTKYRACRNCTGSGNAPAIETAPAP